MVKLCKFQTVLIIKTKNIEGIIFLRGVAEFLGNIAQGTN